MIHRPELLDALQRAPARSLTTTAWRHMFGSRPPDLENTSGARWNPPGVAAIYLSCARSGAVAEGDHAMAVQPIRPRAQRVLYAVELAAANVLDLGDPSDLAGAGLSYEDLGNDDLTACQEVGAAVDWLEHDGLLVPSARSKALNLVLYASHLPVEAVFNYGSGEALSG